MIYILVPQKSMVYMSLRTYLFKSNALSIMADDNTLLTGCHLVLVQLKKYYGIVLDERVQHSCRNFVLSHDF